MPKIISANLNGIRSAAKKGFFEWMHKQNADVICVQELKAQADDMSEDMLAPSGYHGHFHYAEKKGYSGAGVYSRKKPDAVKIGFGSKEFDAEGRYVQLDAAARDLHVEVQRVDHESRIHLDIESDDVDAEAVRLEALGARRLEKVGTWWVMESPTGQRFCVVRAKHDLSAVPGASVWG